MGGAVISLIRLGGACIPMSDVAVIDDVRHTFGDTVWRMLQGRKLKDAERKVMIRTLKALNGREGLEAITTQGTREAFLPGEAIVRAGEVGEDLFLMLDGNVHVVRDGVVVDKFRHGEFFGEIGMLDGSPRSANVVAVDRVVVLRIPRSAVDEGMQKRLWDYAAEHRFANLPFLPVLDTRERAIWYSCGRHTSLTAGEYIVEAPWVFLYYGEVEIGGSTAVAPCLVGGGTIRCAGLVRLALLQEP
jgi:Cyclic nucleotide-binding domain